MKLYSRLACAQKHPKCKFAPRPLSMLAGSRVFYERIVNRAQTAAGLSLIMKLRKIAITRSPLNHVRNRLMKFLKIYSSRFPTNFELSALTSPLVTICANEQRFSSKQDVQSLKVFSGLRRFRDVTDASVQGTCFSCSMGIGKASNTTPETQQTDPTILPRTDDGTTSP